MGHDFIFTPGVWQGEGFLSFSMADDQLPFTMTWTISQMENEEIIAHQLLDVEGIDDHMGNSFQFALILDGKFHVHLTNEYVGSTHGSGLFDEGKIAWEFREPIPEKFQGYEIYEKVSPHLYKMRAEYSSGSGFETYVKGQIRRIN